MGLLMINVNMLQLCDEIVYTRCTLLTIVGPAVVVEEILSILIKKVKKNSLNSINDFYIIF